MNIEQRTTVDRARRAKPRAMKIVRFPLIGNFEKKWLALRKVDVTASVVGALFGLHPYVTAMKVWAEKTGTEFPDEDSTALRRGRLLEEAVAKAFLESHPGWKIRKAKVYLRAAELRLGATPDFFVTDPEGRRGVLQAKTVAPFVFKRSWTAETAPTWITLQALTEAMLSRVEFGIICALVVDGYHFSDHVYHVPRHPAAERRIQDRVREFWADTMAGRQPPVDYQNDAALLDVLYPKEAPGKVVDLRADNMLPELLEYREALRANIKLDEAKAEEIETEIRAKMTDAEAALVQGWRITNKSQHRKAYSVAEKDFRVLRIAREKEL